jgi:hypothetical protein
MRAGAAVVLMGSLILAACGEPERPPPPYFAIPPGPSPQRAASTPASSAPAAAFPENNPEVQYFLPAHPEDVQRGPAAVPRPGAASTPFYAAPINPGPVTGYGPGGMALPPGAPPNPPYPPGGLTGPR